MTLNLVHGLRILRNNLCFRENNRVFRGDNGRTVISDIRKFETRGYVRTIDISRAVVITEKGEKFLKDYRPSPNTLAAGRAFLAAYDRFWFEGEKLTAGPESISAYVAGFFIEDGTLVALPDGRYGKAVTLIEVRPGEVAWVREMLRCLRST